MKQNSDAFDRGVLIALSLAGCAHVNSTVLEAGLSPVPVGQVQVYLAGEDLPSHKKVGILYAEGSANSRQALFEKLREAAGEMGAQRDHPLSNERSEKAHHQQGESPNGGGRYTCRDGGRMTGNKEVSSA